MANRRDWVIFQESLRWRIGWRDVEAMHLNDVSVPSDIEPDAVAAALAEALQALGHQGEAVLLAVHSSLCLAATLLMESQSSARQPQVLLYQFEQSLPLAAEDVVADFVIHDQEALAVAMPFAEQKPLVDGLEERGIPIQSVAPTALLALQAYVDTSPADEPYVLLWQHDDTIEWFRVLDNKPLAWRLLPAESAALMQNLSVETLAQTALPRVITRNLSPVLRAAIAHLPGVQIHEAADEPVLDAAFRTAESVLSGTECPWIELRRDALGSPDPYRAIRGSLRFALVAGVVLLVAMIGGWSYQVYCYGQVADQEQQRQAAAFCEVFPGQPVPQGIRSRLESEHTKLAGLKGASNQLPTQTSAFHTLYDVLAALPDGMRYRFRELRLDRQRAFLEGEVLSHGDADKISAGLRKQGFEVQPPRTQQLASQGVSVRLTAERIKRTPTGPGGGK